MSLLWQLYVLFGIIAGSSFALKCYVCDSETNPNCRNNVKNIESQECVYKTNVEPPRDRKWWHQYVFIDHVYDGREPPYVCQTLVMSNTSRNINDNNNPSSIIIRNCQLATNNPSSCHRVVEQLTRMNSIYSLKCAECGRDECNSATTTNIWLPLMIFPLLFSIVYFVRQ